MTGPHLIPALLDSQRLHLGWPLWEKHRSRNSRRGGKRLLKSRVQQIFSPAIRQQEWERLLALPGTSALSLPTVILWQYNGLETDIFTFKQTVPTCGWPESISLGVFPITAGTPRATENHNLPPTHTRKQILVDTKFKDRKQILNLLNNPTQVCPTLGFIKPFYFSPPILAHLHQSEQIMSLSSKCAI